MFDINLFISKKIQKRDWILLLLYNIIFKNCHEYNFEFMFTYIKIDEVPILKINISRIYLIPFLNM